ncbi:hypothetical protein CYMTET_22506 [Cymbomonas tetramitiformis]|uniref:Glycoside hydrolase family 76 protein n=1 Tax=Cymbomonas tetramitiformis TaxID=36881 RepID=A0AAE0G0M4_9CHLO|nr:hypothetical protein CYMTET_22506 [Cymbomonas tetramitiformis]
MDSKKFALSTRGLFLQALVLSFAFLSLAQFAETRSTPLNSSEGIVAPPYSSACLRAAVRTPTSACLAANAFTSLQSAFYDPDSNRGWPNTQAWINANTIEVLSNFLEQADSTDWENETATIHSIVDDLFYKSEVGDCRAPVSCESWDDLAWWGLAWLRYYEASGKVHFKYLERSQYIYHYISTHGWVQSCGASYQWGSWSESAYTYQNSIIQALMATFSVRLVHYEGSGFYEQSNLVSHASQLWAWMKQHVIQESNLIFDGLDSWTCKVRPQGGSKVWSYNQGVILEALALLAEHTGDRQYVQDGVDLATAAMSALQNDAENRTLVEKACEPTCNGDQVAFKGILARYLGYFALRDGVPEEVASSIWQFLQIQQKAIWTYARQVDSKGYEIQSLYSMRWDTPGGNLDAGSQTSALDVFTQMMIYDKLQPDSKGSRISKMSLA